MANIRSGETYLSNSKATGFDSLKSIVGGLPQDYSVGKLRLNQWGLRGNWAIGPESAELKRIGDAIVFRFCARDQHLVLGPGSAGKPMRFQVTIDSAAPGADHGASLGTEGKGTIGETRLYQLVRQASEVRKRILEIRFRDTGAEAWAFTFG